MSQIDHTHREAPVSGQEYLAVQASPEFQELRNKLRRFVFPMSAVFLIWYFAIDEEGYEDVTLTAISSCSFGPKSKPRSWANAILRRKLGDHEKFNEDDLKNKPVMLSIENEETDRGTFARITGLSPVRGRDRTKAEAEDNAA